MKTGKTAIPMLAVLMLCLACNNLQASTYEVGPSKPLTAIGQVPWESLQAGDTVLIYWRSTPYEEKWVICRQGTHAKRNKSYSQTVQATGGVAPYSWSIVSGSLPPGLSLNSSSGEGSPKLTNLDRSFLNLAPPDVGSDHRGWRDNSSDALERPVGQVHLVPLE